MTTVLKVASDLLVTTAPGKKKPPLKIRQDPKKGFYGDKTFLLISQSKQKKHYLDNVSFLDRILKVEHIIICSWWAEGSAGEQLWWDQCSYGGGNGKLRQRNNNNDIDNNIKQ